MATKRKDNRIKQQNQSALYSSFEEWEMENFPNLVKQEARKELELDPEALGVAMAEAIFAKHRK